MVNHILSNSNVGIKLQRLFNVLVTISFLDLSIILDTLNNKPYNVFIAFIMTDCHSVEQKILYSKSFGLFSDW